MNKSAKNFNIDVVIYICVNYLFNRNYAKVFLYL